MLCGGTFCTSTAGKGMSKKEKSECPLQELVLPDSPQESLVEPARRLLFIRERATVGSRRRHSENAHIFNHCGVIMRQCVFCMCSTHMI
jgi:hypothetical protein